MSTQSLVVIHGVGDPLPGNAIQAVHQCLGPDFGSAYREDIVVDGVDFPCLRLDHNAIEEIVEVNWSEIRRPQKSLIGILRHAIYLLRIYSYSAMRARPYLPLLVGPLAILMDILGDVLFYLLPAEAILGTAPQTQAKVADVIKSLKQNKPNNKVIVLAHSQGTVIAIDALGSAAVPGCDLITLGSPIESLYHRFLANSLENRPSKQVFPKNWWNLYRNDDYIAGPVNLRAVENSEIGAGGHTGYWSEPAVIAAIKKAVNR